MTRLGSISVVIPTRNRAQLLKRAIGSALKSGESCGEVIVVDDGSTDDTREVVASFVDDRVRYLYSDSQGGPAARNLGFRAAQNDLIKFLDDDDYLLAGALARQLEYFNHLDPTSRERVIIYGDVLVTGLHSARSWREIPSRRREGETDVEYLSRVNIQTSCPLHQRHLLEEVGGFDESLRAFQENDIHLRLALKGVHFERCASDVYVFDNSASRNRISTEKRGREVVESRLSLLRRRLQMLDDHFSGELPIGMRQSLARDVRECQRWARSARLRDLERECESLARNLYCGGPIEKRWSGLPAYGLVRRIRSKSAKRVRGCFSRRR